ncbi:Uncharacterised protein [Niallia circulans]|jgi:hypothetical protein|nr:Uncharacterised protein [Niallia circulans]
MKIVKVSDIPKDTILITETLIIVGTGKKESMKNEGICKETRQNVELYS